MNPIFTSPGKKVFPLIRIHPEGLHIMGYMGNGVSHNTKTPRTFVWGVCVKQDPVFFMRNVSYFQRVFLIVCGFAPTAGNGGATPPFIL